MEIYDRLTYLILGIPIGFIGGFITKSFMLIRSKVDHMGTNTQEDDTKDILDRSRWSVIKEEFDKIPFDRVALFLVVMLSLVASFQSQATSHRVQESAVRDARVLECNSEFLGKIILALNERTTYSTGQADSNVDLQQAEFELMKQIIKKPPLTSAEKEEAIRQYLIRLRAFLDLSEKTANKQEANQYPTLDDFNLCVAREDPDERPNRQRSY